MRLCIFIFTAFIFSCSKNKMPHGIIKPEKMQAVYWDFLKADIFTSDFASKDSSKNLKKENAVLQLNIFKNHGVSKEEFYKSYQYYLNHPGIMKDMIDTMLVRQRKNPAENKVQKSIP